MSGTQSEESGNVPQGRTAMKHLMRMTLMAGVAASALTAMPADRGYAQVSDPNVAPNPYKMQENWAKLGDGRRWGSAIKVQVDQLLGRLHFWSAGVAPSGVEHHAQRTRLRIWGSGVRISSGAPQDHIKSQQFS